jgi:hypothetical protein
MLAAAAAKAIAAAVHDAVPFGAGVTAMAHNLKIGFCCLQATTHLDECALLALLHEALQCGLTHGLP